MALPLAIAGAGADILGGLLQGQGQQAGINAAGRQIRMGMGDNRSMSADSRATQTGLQQPYINAGQQALGDYSNFRMSDPGSYQAGSFGGVDMSQDPGMQFRMNQGVAALDASAANRGNLFSGAQQKALTQFGQDLGSQEFNNAYGRQYGQYMDAENANRSQFNTEADRGMNLDQFRMNQLQDLTNSGQQATGQLASSLGGIDQSELNNQLMLRGQYADNRAAGAQNPWQMGANAVAGLGGMSRDMSSYYMNR